MKLNCIKSFSLIHKQLGTINKVVGDDFELSDDKFAKILIGAGLAKEIIVEAKVSKKQKPIIEVEPKVEPILEVDDDAISTE